MVKKVGPRRMAARREDGRRLETQADASKPYRRGTLVNRPNLPSRLFNARLSEEHYAAVQELACERRLPMSTMARAWLPDRLDEELPAS
jgi:hypothetical protein